jgi:hypothetical protein
MALGIAWEASNRRTLPFDSHHGYFGFGATILRARMTVEPLAVVSDYPGLIAALRGRVIELGTSINALDEVAGLPDRYSAKLLSPRAVKNLGPMSLCSLLGALGLARRHPRRRSAREGPRSVAASPAWQGQADRPS